MLELGIPLESGSEPKMKASRRAVTPVVIYYIFFIGMLIIGLYFLYDAILAYTAGDVEVAGYYSIMGMIGVGVSIYMATMLRRRTSTRKIPPKVMTTVECKRCGLKKLRGFVKGDYVLKNIEDCPKCNEPMTITAIYTEKAKK